MGQTKKQLEWLEIFDEDYMRSVQQKLQKQHQFNNQKQAENESKRISK
jgi:hypothetical protein